MLYQGYGDYHDIATRWFDGLVNKDASITNEIYSLSSVDFDRQVSSFMFCWFTYNDLCHTGNLDPFIG